MRDIVHYRFLATLVGLVAVVLVAGTGGAAARQLGNFDVDGAIEAKYDAIGGPDLLGDPIGPESDAANDGKFQAFQRGYLYWSPATDAHQITGDIYVKWASHDFERSDLGYPTSDEFTTKAGGRANAFQGGLIVWTLATTAHIIGNGSILDQWNAAGADAGRYGFPTSDEHAVAGGRAQTFQHGTITVRT